MHELGEQWVEEGEVKKSMKRTFKICYSLRSYKGRWEQRSFVKPRLNKCASSRCQGWLTLQFGPAKCKLAFGAVPRAQGYADSPEDRLEVIDDAVNAPKFTGRDRSADGCDVVTALHYPRRVGQAEDLDCSLVIVGAHGRAATHDKTASGVRDVRPYGVLRVTVRFDTFNLLRKYAQFTSRCEQRSHVHDG